MTPGVPIADILSDSRTLRCPPFLLLKAAVLEGARESPATPVPKGSRLRPEQVTAQAAPWGLQELVGLRTSKQLRADFSLDSDISKGKECRNVGLGLLPPFPPAAPR